MQTADGKSSIDRLGEIATLFEKSKLELREAENSRDALRRQIVGEEPVLLPEAPGADASISLPEIDGRIDVQKRNLDALLQKYTQRDARLVAGPRVGEDVAVIDMGDRYMVVKTDPITFATDQIGWYAVNVNANDIATAVEETSPPKSPAIPIPWVEPKMRIAM